MFLAILSVCGEQDGLFLGRHLEGRTSRLAANLRSIFMYVKGDCYLNLFLSENNCNLTYAECSTRKSCNPAVMFDALSKPEISSSLLTSYQ